jgi:hypothetical protein
MTQRNGVNDTQKLLYPLISMLKGTRLQITESTCCNHYIEFNFILGVKLYT